MGRRAYLVGQRGESDAVRPAPFACHFDTAIYRFGNPVFARIHKVVEIDFGPQYLDFDWPSELAASAGCNRGVAGVDPRKCIPEPAVSRHLDNLEVVVNEPVGPSTRFTYRPDDPQLVGAATDSFLEIGICVVDRVDAAIAIDVHWWKPHWQRHTRDQLILVHRVRFGNLQSEFAEVVIIEGGLALAHADF